MSSFTKLSHDKTGFHSKGERECYEYLKGIEKEGIIEDIRCQVRVKLLNGINHDTDFRYTFTGSKETVWAEYKGFEDQRWRMVKKIWARHGPGRLFVYKGKGMVFGVSEIIIPLPGCKLNKRF